MPLYQVRLFFQNLLATLAGHIQFSSAQCLESFVQQVLEFVRMPVGQGVTHGQLLLILRGGGCI